MADPGVSLKQTTLAVAWELAIAPRATPLPRLRHPEGTPSRRMSDPQEAVREAPEEAAASSKKQEEKSESTDMQAEAREAGEVIEALAMAKGMRARRVILDENWWRHAGGPMVARIADRRRTPRGGKAIPSPTLAEGTGWVALVPDLGGYRIRALDDKGEVAEWRVNEKTAMRLSPFAFAFYRRFAPRALAAGDMLRFAVDHGGRDLALLMIAGMAAGLIGLFTPLATGWLIDHVIPASDISKVQAIIAGLAVAGVAVIALDVLRSLAVLRFESRIGVAMQAALVDRVVSAPAKFFRNYASGDLALRMGSVNTIQRTITGSTIGAFVTSLFLLSNIALMVMYSPRLTISAMSLVLGVVAISTAFGLARLKVGPRIEALDGKLSSMHFEMFSGISKLRAAAAEGRVLGRWYARYDEFRRTIGVSARLSNIEVISLNLLQPAATILVLWMAWRLASTAPLTTGDFVAFHAALFALLGGVQVLVTTALDLVNLKPLWDRARPILETAPEDAGHQGERHDPQGAIDLANVSFAYPGGPRVLQDVSLSIAPGEFVAIVGASGSGKSTLLRLLLGFETPAEGSVRYDGKDLATLDLRYLRRRVGTVLQGGKLWAGDLLSNIVAAHAVGVDAATEAAKRAGLERDIEAMPMGLYTVVGEGLSTLSGGQRQRVLIARALVGNPRILLLDEATSALDNVSQATVLRGLASLEATRVVIAHRLNTVREADRIVVLDHGRVVQQGTFAELAAEAGPFRAMLARQVA